MNIEELRKAYEAATPGIQSVDEENFATTMEIQADQLVETVGTEREWVSVCIGDEEDALAEVVALAHPTNARFIALAHNAFPALLKAVELLSDARNLIAEAMDNHIYNEADGEVPDENCQYAAFLKEADAVLKGVKNA